MSKRSNLIWMKRGSPDVSGDLAKGWKDEKTISKHRLYHAAMSAMRFFAGDDMQNMKNARPTVAECTKSGVQL